MSGTAHATTTSRATSASQRRAAAPSRSGPRTAPRPSPQPTPRPRLRVVPAPRPAARRAPFVIVVITLLVLGLATLLVLNMVLAQGAFRLHDLQHQVSVLADKEQALQQDVAVLAAPQHLAAKAHALGMVPMVNPVFIRASDGKVLGRAAPATGLLPEWARVPVHPRPQPSATPTPSPSGDTTPSAADVQGKPGATQQDATTSGTNTSGTKQTGGG